MPFGGGVNRFIEGDGETGFIVLGLPKINPDGGGLAFRGALSTLAARQALGEDGLDGDGSGRANVPQFGTPDPENNPKAVVGAQEMARLIGEGLARTLQQVIAAR